MSPYTMTVRVYQTNHNSWFFPCETTVWHYANGGTWCTQKGKHVLNMGGSGTSGIMRFQSDCNQQESFLIAIGIHNYKPWGSIVGLQPGQTGALLHSQFYNGGPHSNANLNDVGTHSMVSAHERKITMSIKHDSDSHYTVDLTIG